MKLTKEYARKSTLELIQALENPGDYDADTKTIIETELRERERPYEEIQDFAFQVNRRKIQVYLDKFDAINDELVVLDSYFLSENEMRELLKEEFQNMMSDRDAFRFNVMQYGMGG